MFLVDISPSMGKMRAVEIPGPSGGDAEVIEMTNLEWSLQFVMLKIQEMVCPTPRVVYARYLDRETFRSSMDARPTSVA